MDAIKMTGIKCPHCGGQIVKSEKYIYCEHSGKEEGMCHFFTTRVMQDGSEISDDDIERLTKGEKVGPYLFHSNKKNVDYYAFLQANPVSGKISLVFPESKDVTNHTCPKCGRKLVKRSGKYGDFLGCPNNDFTMSTSFSGHDFNTLEIDKLLKGETIGPFDLYSRNKLRWYSASLRLNPETNRIEPLFD